jgi:acetyltransferase-like isoleucine patch superfamily enzyme
MNFKEHSQFLHKDFRGELFFLLSPRKLSFIRVFSNFYMQLSCFAKGVKIYRSTTFTGSTYFYRFPTSQIEIGKRCRFNSTRTSNMIGVNGKCIISTGLPKAQLIIGNQCGFSGTVIGAYKFIKIGNNVRCGANTLITDSDWHLDDARSGEPADVIIEDGVWLGINVVVLKGVTIGENSLIGANSVVTKSIPANVIAAGNPCKVIRKIDLNDAN